MSLTPGFRIGAYEITAPLGVGGMGEVYRATDTNLGREVAIKVLPDAFAQDMERLARLEREARTLAVLNHPNVAQIYGLERADGMRALVMELVEGPTLADRIAQGPLPPEEALPIATQIAKAVEAAHEQSIIHRDLKPANIKLRPDGTVKVLDFGLAKAMEPAVAAPPNQSMSPTITTPAMTQAGIILGTAAYMSPEQAKGRPADKRSDVWAFGCVAYEMLTGRRAFSGEDISDTLALVLKGEPDWTLIPADVARPVRTLLQRCLQKNRAARVADLSTAVYVLTENGSVEATAQPERSSMVRRALPYVAACLATGVMAAFVTWALKPTTATPKPVSRFVINTANSTPFTAVGRHVVAISPTGTHIVYAANDRLYLRAVNQLDASPVRGTEAQPRQTVGNTAGGDAFGREPFFSSDGQRIGFWQAGQLKKVSLAGGPAVSLCSTTGNLSGASWGADDTIFFGQGASGIWRVSGAGGTPENIIKVESGQAGGNPELLPGGRALIFTLADDNWEKAQVVAYVLASRTLKVLLTQGSDAHYVPSGHLVYSLQDSLLAVPFDVDTLTVTGGAVPLVEGVARSNRNVNAIAQYDVSDEGTLVYVPRSAVAAASERTLVWVDRQGREEPIKVQPHGYMYPRLSPDGTRIAVEIRDNDNEYNIWTLDLARLTLTPLTFGSLPSRAPLWMADGRRILFNTGSGARGALSWASADGSGTAEPVTGSEQGDFATSVSSDGTRLIVSANTTTDADVGMLALGREQPTGGGNGNATNDSDRKF